MEELLKVTIEDRKLEEILLFYQDKPGSILSIMEDMQESIPHNYLPLPILKKIAQRTNTPLSQIYSVATFYTFFNLDPQGNHTVSVCRGTACHTRGSRTLLESLKRLLMVNDVDINEADKLTMTTKDNEYTIRTVACFGQCALAPVVSVDHHIYGHMNELNIKKSLENLSKKENKE